MATTINAAASAGLVTTADTSTILQLQTAGVTALSISAAQVVSFTNPVTLVTPTIDSAQVPTVSGTAPLYMCRAWVNFNGTGTVAIRASGNVSSITDNGVGDYTVNFTTAMPDANYCVQGTGSSPSAGNGVALSVNEAFLPTTTTARMSNQNDAGVRQDGTSINVAIFR